MSRPKHITDMQAIDIAADYLKSADGDYDEAAQSIRKWVRGRRNANLVIRALFEVLEAREIREFDLRFFGKPTL